MLQIRDSYETHYDPATKIWSGRQWRRFYNSELSFGQIAFEQMRRRPNKICQISDSEGTQLTNEQMLLQAIKIVKYFELKGIKQHDVIGIGAHNTTYLFGVVLACFFHGCAYHAMNIKLDKSVLKEVLKITRPKLLFFDGQNYEKIQFAIKDLNTEIITLSNHVDDITSVLDLLSLTPSEKCNGYEPANLEEGPDQTLAILSTSGSTSTPKAVKIPNSTKIYEAVSFLTEDDVQGVFSTIDWISGFMSITGNIIYGAVRIITEKPWTPEYCVEMFRKYKVTFTILLSAHLSLIVKTTRTTSEDLSSLSNILCGGSVCPTMSMNEMKSRLKNGRILYAYTFSELFDFMSKNREENRPDSVGRLAPGFKVRIIDDNGKPLGPGEIGEVWIKNPLRWSGYYENPKATAEMIDNDGWYHSGDLGYFDDDGFLFIIGRKKDMLRCLSIDYHPSSIEAIIMKMPEVRQACVFGVYDKSIGDAPTAAVVPMNGVTLTAEDVVDFVKSNAKDEHKKLHGGAIIVTQPEMGSTPKINRKAVKKMYLERNRK